MSNAMIATFKRETDRFYRFDIGRHKEDDVYRGQIFLRKDRPIPEKLIIILDGAKKLKPKKIKEDLKGGENIGRNHTREKARGILDLHQPQRKEEI